MVKQQNLKNSLPPSGNLTQLPIQPINTALWRAIFNNFSVAG